MDESSIATNVSEFIRLDDGLKVSRKKMKEVRAEINTLKSGIVEFMVREGIDRFTNIKGGTQCLECVEKTLKKRPTSEQMTAKLTQMLADGINDPAKLMEGLNSCGGTYTEHRLLRKTKRVSAASLVAAATTPSGSEKAGRPKHKRARKL